MNGKTAKREVLYFPDGVIACIFEKPSSKRGREAIGLLSSLAKKGEKEVKSDIINCDTGRYHLGDTILYITVDEKPKGVTVMPTDFSSLELLQ